MSARTSALKYSDLLIEFSLKFIYPARDLGRHFKSLLFLQGHVLILSIIIMKRIVLVLLLINFLPSINLAQESVGIHFEQRLSWQQIKEKAKAENKYIFVDCFATWCGPCKRMDREVYPVDSIGQLFNRYFISVKVQMDSTAKDDEHVKNFRADAKSLQNSYQVNAFPTFLFFSPYGKIVHKGIGFTDASGFAYLAHNALDSSKQYFTLLSSFRHGNLSYRQIYKFAIIARAYGNRELADSVATFYINHLYEFGRDSIYTPQNLALITDFTRSSKIKTFDLFYHHGREVDSVMKRPNLSRNLIDAIIESEEINSKLYPGGKTIEGKPEWITMRNNIIKAYNSDYADRIIIWAKVKWFEQKKDWKNYAANLILKVERYGPYDKVFYQIPQDEYALWNFCSWDLFFYSDESKNLRKALEWSKKSQMLSPKPDPEFMDTYANILYKLHRKREALEWEAKALKLRPNATDIADNLSKMKKGLPTWNVPTSK